MTTTCSACKAENRQARRFCHACAAALVKPCENCGFENYPEERYCGGCALDLGTVVPHEEPATEPIHAAPPSSAERRQVTVLFCDMVGSTALSTELDPEDLRDLLTRFQGACAAEVTRCGGFIARYMGDGMLVYFGYPRAYEDGAMRAVRSGLAIVQAVAALGARPVQPSVRVGIATGSVVVGDIIGEGQSEERAVVGETPNLAARLQALAEEGTVVISERTRRLVANDFELQDLGTHELKGLPEPIRAWRAMGTARRVDPISPASSAERLPMYGRDTELSLLKHRFAEARDGRGGVVILSGVAGSGKSHLVDALTSSVLGSVSSSALLVRHACLSHHDTTTLFPVVEQITRACGIELSDPRAVRLEKVRSFVERWSDAVEEDEAATHMILSLDDDEATSPEDRRRAMLRSIWRRLLRPRGGLVLAVFEDVQWADPTTLELIEGLIEQSTSHATMLLLTHRQDFEPPWRSTAGVTSLSLGRLEEQAARRLVQSVAGSTAMDPLVVDTIAERADGVPGFVVELTRAVVASGGGSTADPEDRLRVPETLHDSLAAQLDDLGAARALAQTAAVIGRSFSRALLARISGMGDKTLDAHLETLVSAGFFLKANDATDSHYAFRHALLCDLAYERLLKSDRRRLHGCIATALLEELPDAADADPVSTARHLVRAGRPHEAAEWWSKAGARAASQGAFPEAVAHLRCAVAVLEPAIDRSDPKDCVKLADLEIDLTQKLRVLAEAREAFERLDRAEALVTPHQALETLSHISFARGNLHFNEGDAEACSAAHQRALELAEQSGSVLAQVRALGGLADARLLVGDRKGGVELGERCVNLALEHGFETIAAANAAATAFGHFWAMDSKAASRMIDIAERLGKKHRMLRVLLIALNVKAMLAAERNDPDEGDRVLADRDEWLGPEMSFGRMWFTGYRQFRVRGKWKEGHEYVEQRLAETADARGWNRSWQGLEHLSLLAEAGDSFESDLAECYEAVAKLPRNLTDFAAMGILEALIHRRAWSELADAIERFADKGVNDRVPRVALWLNAARAALAYGRDPENAGNRAEVERLIELARGFDAASVELTLRELTEQMQPESRASAE